MQRKNTEETRYSSRHWNLAVERHAIPALCCICAGGKTDSREENQIIHPSRIFPVVIVPWCGNKIIRNAQDASGGKMDKSEHNQKDAKEEHTIQGLRKKHARAETWRIKARGRNELQEMEEQSKGQCHKQNQR